MASDYQGQIDFMVGKFQQLTMKCENLEKIHQSLQADIKDFIKQLQELKSSKNVLDDRITGVTVSHNDLSLSHSDVASRLDRYSEDVKAFKLSIKVLAEKMQSLQASYEESCSLIYRNSNKIADLASKAELELCKKDLRQHQNDSSLSHGLLKDDLMNLSKVINALNDKMNAFQQQMKDLRDFFSQISSKVDLLSKDHESTKLNLTQMVSDSKLDLSNLIKNSIAAIPPPQVPSMEEIKSVISKHTEPMGLAANNAHIRSQNNENKVIILERKVEQLSLLLNKMQMES